MTEFDKMVQLLDASWAVRSQIVPCLVGPPGIGKTAAVMQHAKAHGCGKVVKIVASRCVPSETVGMTMPDHEHRSMDIYNSMQLSSLRDGDILFLDELLEADQFVLSTLLTVIESREMADGTPLPDIQIVAATNDTIPPEQLKGNIRQRFMFMRFRMDTNQVRDYVYERTGIKLGPDVLNKVCEKGNDYNFLTPRSLTKLCLWVDATEADKVDEVAGIINAMWGSTIGSEIAIARRTRDRSPEKMVRHTVKQFFNDNSVRLPEELEERFEDCTMGELYEMLQEMPEWSMLKDYLSNIEMAQDDGNHVDIRF